MVNSCADFVLAFKHDRTNPRWITLLGPSGIGKTHCATKLWNLARDRSVWAYTEFNPQVVYWPEYVSRLRSGKAFDHVRDMLDWPVVFIDDIGADRDTSGFASEQLNMLLGRREGKWTILTSNLSLEQIGSIEPRIADRIIRSPNIFIETEARSYSLPYKD